MPKIHYQFIPEVYEFELDKSDCFLDLKITINFKPSHSEMLIKLISESKPLGEYILRY